MGGEKNGRPRPETSSPGADSRTNAQGKLSRTLSDTVSRLKPGPFRGPTLCVLHFPPGAEVRPPVPPAGPRRHLVPVIVRIPGRARPEDPSRVGKGAGRRRDAGMQPERAGGRRVGGFVRKRWRASAAPGRPRGTRSTLKRQNSAPQNPPSPAKSARTACACRQLGAKRSPERPCAAPADAWLAGNARNKFCVFRPLVGGRAVQNKLAGVEKIEIFRTAQIARFWAGDAREPFFRARSGHFSTFPAKKIFWSPDRPWAHKGVSRVRRGGFPQVILQCKISVKIIRNFPIKR